LNLYFFFGSSFSITLCFLCFLLVESRRWFYLPFFTYLQRLLKVLKHCNLSRRLFNFLLLRFCNYGIITTINLRHHKSWINYVLRRFLFFNLRFLFVFFQCSHNLKRKRAYLGFFLVLICYILRLLFMSQLCRVITISNGFHTFLHWIIFILILWVLYKIRRWVIILLYFLNGMLYRRDIIGWGKCSNNRLSNLNLVLMHWLRIIQPKILLIMFRIIIIWILFKNRCSNLRWNYIWHLIWDLKYFINDRLKGIKVWYLLTLVRAWCS